MTLSKRSPSFLRTKHLAFAISTPEELENFQFHWLLSTNLSLRHGFYPESLSGYLAFETTSATLLLEILYVQLQVPRNEQATIEKIISLLDTPTQPRLIVLDKLRDTFDGSQKQVEDIPRRPVLLSLVSILVTMRGRDPPSKQRGIKWQSKDIRPADEAPCLRIFDCICS